MEKMTSNKTVEKLAREIESARGSAEMWHCRDTYCPNCTYKRCTNSYVAESLYELGYRERSEVIDEFAERLKNYPINNLEKSFTIAEIIDEVAMKMKGGAE